MKFPRLSSGPENRRGFLAFVRPVGDRAGRREDTPDRLIRTGRRAMACDFEILMPSAFRPLLMAAHEAFDEIDRLESQMTVYRDSSEIARINRQAPTGKVSVEPGLFELLRRAVELSRLTGGAFDVTSGALSRCWGFLNRQGRLPEASEIEAALERVGSRHLHLDQDEFSIRFDRPVEINLGAIGKGYALDRAGGTLRRRGVRDALLHAGFSSFLALGSAPFSQGWPVGLQDPARRDRDIAVLHLKDRALAYSGSGVQNFVSGNRRFGHVIDPRTGWPAERRSLAAAVADSAAEADALATAFYLMSPREVEDFCRNRPGVGALLVTEEPEEGNRTLHHFGLESCLTEVVC